ncbi:MAG: hypothetical protein ABIJ17_02220 [Patescibacteria group bacterium]
MANNEQKIKCPKCGSISVRKAEDADSFLSYKGEGEPAKKAKTKIKQKYFCLEENCNYEWEEDTII